MSRRHIPGVWYELSARLSAAHSVIGAFDYYNSSTLQPEIIQRQLDAMGDIANAAFELLNLCKADCEALEKALLEIPDPPPGSL
ncbi:MAG TPA: hypothetical protein PK406_15025 [Verrucomicrobiota bacterium]|nr:hypothetical protein [Verrucomicrobiota bacterium]